MHTISDDIRDDSQSSSAARPRCRRGASFYLLLILALAACSDDSTGGDGDGGSDILTDGGGDVTDGGGDLTDGGDGDATDGADGGDGDATDGGDVADGGDDAADGDVTPACAEVGASCASSACCDDGVCVSGGAGSICAPSCEDDLDCSALPNTACQPPSGDPGGALACRAVPTNQCEACADDAECPGAGNRCVALAGGASYCLQECQTDDQCDALIAGAICLGYTLDRPEGTVVTALCTPPDQQCSCVDPDGDGYGSGPCENPGGDCAPDDGTRHPGATEVCNGLDDNCDDDVDELWDTQTDAEHCGACDNACADGVACVGGVCEVTCEEGLGDCDADPSTCETSLTDDVNNCGACDRVCAFTNGVAGCVAGVCVLSDCQTGFADIDSNPANGCEAVCDPANPGPEVCDGEDNDCDGVIDEGFNLAGDVDNCGGCGVVCGLTADVTGVACVGGDCVITACTAGAEDCDALHADGCEVSVASDPANCGGCGVACDFGAHTVAACGAAGCEFAGCEAGWDDCNGDLSDGCEVNTGVVGACACVPNETRPCYTGPAGTRNVGVCADGTQFCSLDGLSWGACLGQTLPQREVCGNSLNDDCAGGVDDPPDEDGDGWTICNGDCCDALIDGCTAPASVNPGAYDYVDPDAGAAPYDDDCDGAADNPLPTTCSPGISVSGTTGADLARAMDLCKFTTEGSGEWGVISAQLLRANGSTPQPANVQVGVLNSFGTNVAPQANATIAALSSGTARDQDGDGDDTGYIYPDGSGHSQSSNEVLAPSDYLSAHGGQLQTAPGCPNGDTTVNDSVQLRLRVRVPTNAQGLRYNFKFYSAEYPEWVCDSFNDFFLAMLYTGAAGIPADRNISFDAAGNPVSVNNAFFEVCQGCSAGTAELANTGYPSNNAGGTSWLFTTAPVVPGEVMELHFHIWDTGDHAWDSLVLIDNFEWQLDPTTVDTGEQ